MLDLINETLFEVMAWPQTFHNYLLQLNLTKMVDARRRHFELYINRQWLTMSQYDIHGITDRMSQNLNIETFLLL